MTLDIQFQQNAKFGDNQDQGDLVDKSSAGELGSDGEANMGDYNSKTSKISGATDFSFISEFSEV